MVILVILGMGGNAWSEVVEKCRSAVQLAVDDGKAGKLASGGKRPIPVECQYYQVRELPSSLQGALLETGKNSSKQLNPPMKISVALGELYSAGAGSAEGDSCEARVRRLLENYEITLRQARASRRNAACRTLIVDFLDRWKDKKGDCGSQTFREASPDFVSFFDAQIRKTFPEEKGLFELNMGLNEFLTKMPSKMLFVLQQECDRKT